MFTDSYMISSTEIVKTFQLIYFSAKIIVLNVVSFQEHVIVWWMWPI